MRLSSTYFLTILVSCQKTFLFAVAAEVNYDALFVGVADIGTYRFPGDLYWISADGDSKAFAYYGIKYGNSKRFEPSWMNKNFSYMASATRDKYGPQCEQPLDKFGSSTPAFGDSGSLGQLRMANFRVLPGIPSLNTSEDCLYLDVYVPAINRNQRQFGVPKRPVLIFVHGGSFESGNKAPGIGTELARSSNLIVVAVQYRLGMFGFLSTEDANAPGNYGLGDVKLALKWVQQNIEGFGGDVDRITLMGHGAGSMLVSAMMLDPEVRNGVHATIMMSGSMLSPMALTQSPRTNAAAVAGILRCPTSSTTEMVLCFKIATAQDIVSATNAAFPGLSRGPADYKFAMAIDGVHVPYKPEWVLQSSPWEFRGGVLSGFMAEDASLILQERWPAIFTVGQPTLEQLQTSLLPAIVRSLTGCAQTPQNILDAINTRYGFSSSVDYLYLRKKMIALATDIMYRGPAAKEASIYAGRNLTELGNQLYVMSYMDDPVGDSQNQVPPSKPLGAFHGLDLHYLFSYQGLNNPLTNKVNEKLTRQMRLLMSYVATNGKGFGRQYDHKRGNLLDLGQDQTWTMRQDPALDDLVLFWDKIAGVGCSASTPIVAYAALMQGVASTGVVTNQTAHVQVNAGAGAGTFSGRSGYPGGGFPAFFPLTGSKSLFNLGQGSGRLLGIIQI